MGDLGVAVRLYSSLYLSVVGVALTMLVWRLSVARPLIRALREGARKRQLHPLGSDSLRLLGLYRVHAAVTFLGSAACFVVVWRSVGLMRGLIGVVGPDGPMYDAYLMACLRDDFATDTATTLAALGVAFALFAVDYALAAVSSEGFRTVEVCPSLGHVAVIPRRWRFAPRSLWAMRIEWLLRDTLRDDQALRHAYTSGSWLQRWPAWNASVVKYGSIAAAAEADDDAGDLPSRL